MKLQLLTTLQVNSLKMVQFATLFEDTRWNTLLSAT